MIRFERSGLLKSVQMWVVRVNTEWVARNATVGNVEWFFIFLHLHKQQPT